MNPSSIHSKDIYLKIKKKKSWKFPFFWSFNISEKKNDLELSIVITQKIFIYLIKGNVYFYAILCFY